jgi:hypothetical protein
MKKLFNQFLIILKSEYFLLTLILLAGFAVRLYKIDNPIADWHSWRQADTASVTKIFVNKGLDFFTPRYYDVSSAQSGLLNPEGYRFVELPIYNLAHYLLFKAYPSLSLEVWGRLTSIIFSLGSGLVLYLLGRRFLGKWGGVLSTFFFMFIPFNIYFSRVILPEPTAVFFGVLAIYLFSKFIDKDRFTYLLFSGISFSLALLVKPYIVFYGIPMIYLFLTKYPLSQFKNLKGNLGLIIKLGVFAGIILVPLILWRIRVGEHPEGIPFWKWAFNGDDIRFRPAFWRWIYGERLGKLILGVWGLVPFVYGIIKAKKESLFIHFFLLGMFFYTLVVATANVKHDYYQTFIIPAVSLTLAAGVKYLWEEVSNRILTRIVLIFSVILMLGMGWYQVKEYYPINHPEIIEAGKAIDKIAPKDAKVIASYNGDTAFLYQTNRFGWPVVDNSIDNIISRGASYYVTVILNDADTKMIVERFKVIEKTDRYLIADLKQPLRLKTTK